ncbi:hypothetical protein [Pontibacter cellulosilyticus]|uniref:STAS/SEC14 domain-containing protein n=1 Tax=Pontibacter cellulosilyticus TaxID=1720253 RepID=A0A923N4C4_9BACT|nr:hypothetical protein [Pontibacter cellulosilyticus]MBC5991998.1 hypothetical protein [Pontibacter cellulosilyticus]
MHLASQHNFQLQTVYEDEYLKVEIDEKQSFIYVEWYKHPSSDKFRQLFQKLAAITIDNKIEYWLSDARAIHYLEFSDQNWLLQTVAPLLKKSTLKKFARVTTKEGLALMDATRIYSGIEQQRDFEVKTKFELFISKEAALDWLYDGDYH